MILPVLLLVAAMGTMTKAEGMEEFSPEVETKQGTLRGIIRKAESDRNFYSFRGIPYAKAPVGPLRFKVRQTIGRLSIVTFVLYLQFLCIDHSTLSCI